jgi:hypothetical protein
MPNPKPLTGAEIDAITKRAAAGAATQLDVVALVENGETLADMLSDCWLALDELARTRWSSAGDLVEAMAHQKRHAGMLLIRQRAPGWKREEGPKS